MTTLEQWLLDATKGLSAESAAQVRAEIQQHYDSACEAGDTADAIAALGDPRAANRAYRKVLLTKREARMTRDLAQGKRPSIWRLVYDSYVLVMLVQVLSGNHHVPDWPIWVSIFCTTPLAWFFPLTTLERSRICIYSHGIRLILGVAAAWWYASWISALVLGAALFLDGYFTIYPRLSIFRKLDLSR